MADRTTTNLEDPGTQCLKWIHRLKHEELLEMRRSLKVGEVMHVNLDGKRYQITSIGRNQVNLREVVSK